MEDKQEILLLLGFAKRRKDTMRIINKEVFKVKVNNKMKREVYTQIAGHGITEVLKVVKMACEEMRKATVADYLDKAILENEAGKDRYR